MNTVIYTGERALELARDQDFQVKWRALQARCPWATACQHPEFVLPWYALYHDQAVPVVVLAENRDGSLAGLFTLALFYRRLVGAGERQAEYQAWLETEDTGSAFIASAVEALSQYFPGVDLHLKYLPPGVPLDWARGQAKHTGRSSLRPFQRPLITIDKASARKWLSKKQIRQSHNRLRRQGDVQFTRITDHEQFADLFDTIRTHYDFRQMAQYHVTPFANDPAKEPFYLELHKRGLLHAAVLTVGGKLVAAHCGVVCPRGALHLGIIMFAPQFASHSPGQLLIAMLVAQLAEEGMTHFDLTPGGDYKERYANAHDVVHEMTIYGTIESRIKGETLFAARNVLQNALNRADLSAGDARAALKRLSRFREIGLPGMRESVRRVTHRAQLYRLNPDRTAANLDPLPVTRDGVDDLFRFDPRGAHLTRWELLDTAMQRMQDANEVYSYHEGGPLLAFCWARAVSTPKEQPTLPLERDDSTDCFLLYDLYVHRTFRDSDRVRRFVQQVVFDLRSRHGWVDIAFNGALTDDLRCVLGQCGFSPVADAALVLASAKRNEMTPSPARTDPLKQADGTMITCYVGEAPPFIANELVRLYDTLHSSLPFFQVFRSPKRLHSYVARRGGKAVAIFLFELRSGKVDVLNEMIEIDRVELRRFVQYVFDAFPTVGSISFKALKADTADLSFPLQKYNAKDTYVIDLPATDKEYTSALGKSTRTAVRYQLNKVMRDHPSFESRFYEAAEIDPRHIHDILRYSEARISSKAYQFFHDDQRIVRLARSCGFVHALFIDGKLCAGSINYRVGTSVFGEAIGQDPAYERYGLGKLTVYLSVCESINRGARKFYLGGGRFDFKERMRGVRLDMDRIEIYRSYGTVVRHLNHAAKAAFDGRLRGLKVWLRDHEENVVTRFVFACFYRCKRLVHSDKSLPSKE